MKTTEINYKAELIQHAIDQLENKMIAPGHYACEIHNTLFNQNYYIIGRYKAEQWLINGPGVFEAIGEIKDYEQSDFGEILTDISEPERVVNMYVYIKGEEILNDCKTIQDKWNEGVTKTDIKKIIKELKKQLKSA